MHKVLIADAIAEEGLTYLRARPAFEVVVATGESPEALASRIADCDAVIVRSSTRITRAILSAAERLRVVGRAGIGVDNIDVEAATERGVVVLNTPDANATTTAELTVAHLLSLSRHLPQADRSVRAGEWRRASFLGTEVAGKTLGVIGYGTIGRLVAARALGLKMRVLAHDPYVTREVMEADGVGPVGLDELLGSADYVSLHCTLSEKTRKLLDASRLRLMRRGARLINCARGGLVDEGALFEALRTGQLSGAALDVFEHEPPRGSPLLGRPDVVLSPHLGASTEEAQVAAGLAVAEQIASYFETGEAINAVNLPRITPAELNRLRPYQVLGHRLGQLLAALVPGPLQEVEVALRGRAAELDPYPIATECLVGLLEAELSVPVNQVNARHLARRQGITLVESRSLETDEYLSLVTVAGRYNGGRTSVAGTLLGERHARLVRIDDCEVESVPEGTVLITRHEDRPGVVGALGTLLGREDVNISRMQVGVASGPEALAVIGISHPLSAETLRRVAATPAIHQVYQLTF